MSVNCTQIITNAAGLRCLMIKDNIITARSNVLSHITIQETFFGFYFHHFSQDSAENLSRKTEWLCSKACSMKVSRPLGGQLEHVQSLVWVISRPLWGKGKLPVTTEGRRLVCKTWLKPGQYKVKITLELGFWIWYELPQGSESAGRNYTVQEKLRLALGQRIRTYSLAAILPTSRNTKHNAS